MSDNYDSLKAKADQMKQREVAKIEAPLRDELSAKDAELAALHAELAEARKAIQDCVDHAHGRESEWGDRAKKAFGYLHAYLSAHPAPKAPEKPVLDPNRCAVCGWPLAALMDKGCVRGNCSMRPRPERLYDSKRAQAEARMAETPDGPSDGSGA